MGPTPQVIGNDNPSLESQCLAFIQTLVNQEIGFKFQLTSGSFSCSFENNGKRKITSARIPTQVKHKSPSSRKRDAIRRQKFLESKKSPSSVDNGNPAQLACEISPEPAHNERPQTSAQKEPSQPFSGSLCFPSTSDSAILDSNNHGGGHITKKLRMDKVPPLKVLIDPRASPKFRIQQLDGDISLPVEDGEPCLCDDNQQSEHDDDPKKGQSTRCPNCDQILLSISHQCHDPDQQIDTHIDNVLRELEKTMEKLTNWDPNNSDISYWNY